MSWNPTPLPQDRPEPDYIDGDARQFVEGVEFTPICPTSSVIFGDNPLEWFLNATIDELCALGVDLGVIWGDDPLCT